MDLFFILLDVIYSKVPVVGSCSAVGPDVLVFSSQMGRGIHHENGHGTENEWPTGGEKHFFKLKLLTNLPHASVGQDPGHIWY